MLSPPSILMNGRVPVGVAYREIEHILDQLFIRDYDFLGASRFDSINCALKYICASGECLALIVNSIGSRYINMVHDRTRCIHVYRPSFLAVVK